jgi:adenosylcobinamide amidohydrolase
VSDLFAFECRPPWLLARFRSPQRIVSWSLNRPGFVVSDTVAWLQVKNADLPIGLDPKSLLESRLGDEGLGDAVALMTARDIRAYEVASAGEGDRAVETMVTLGLGNAVALDPAGRPHAVAREAEPVGTINALVACSQPLGDGALLEAISVATVARTAALLTDGGRAIGTGTDCIAIACPVAEKREIFAGLHTEIGTNIASAVFRATRDGRRAWEREQAVAPRP